MHCQCVCPFVCFTAAFYIDVDVAHNIIIMARRVTLAVNVDFERLTVAVQYSLNDDNNLYCLSIITTVAIRGKIKLCCKW